MTRSPGAWPRKSSSVHRKRREPTTAEGPCTPSGCQRAVGSGRYRSPSSRYLYRVPGATLAMVRVKTSSAPRVIGCGRRPSIATSTDRHRGAQTAKVTVSSRTLAPSTFIRSNEPPMGSAFSLVLHTHLPMVLNHGRWPHGSDWLCEAASDCYLPLLGRDESIHLQLRTAVETHRRHFGQAPRGIWLPECAYRPRYEWTPPTGRDSGRVRWVRPGIEELLARHGLEYFVADAHLVSAGDPVFLYRDFVPFKAGRDVPASSVPGTEARSPYASYRVASPVGSGSAVALFPRPKTTLQVWSRAHGYPGDYAYLEFHKKHFPGGLRFWRITDNSGDLGRKIAYDPALAAQKVGLQARHFVELVTSTLAAARADGPAVVCSPYDAELFGHWWFEGPLWLEQVTREMARGGGVTPATLGEALAAVEPRATLALPEGSWGEGGDHRVWLNRDTEGTRHRVYSAEAEWAAHLAATRAAKGDLARALTQATRELLLLQASDWQFLITTGTARDYAERRVAEHYAEFKRLSEMARGLASGEPLSPDDANSLRRLEREDFCFPDLEPAWGMGPPGQG